MRTEQLRQIQNQYYLLKSQVCAIEAISAGLEVDDFTVSFPLVREVYDLYREYWELEDKIKALEA